MANCPALVIAASGTAGTAPGTVVAAGAMGSLETLEVKRLRAVGRISGSRLVGATEDIYMPDNSAHGSRLGTVGNPFRQVGLVLEGKGGLDTVEFFDAGSRLGPAPGCTKTMSWSKCLEVFPGFGLLHAPLLPSWPDERPALSSWILEERDGYLPRRSPGKVGFKRITLFYQERPGIPGQPRFFESGPGSWVVSVGERFTSLAIVPDTAKRISESQVDGFVRRVAFSRPSSEGWVLAAVESGGYYSDGDFADLHLVSLHPKSDTVHAAVIPFTGSSGEPGGSSVEGAWWHQDAPGGRRRLYVVNAQEGNENGESRDARVWAFEVGGSGILKRVPGQSFPAAVFGKPSRWQAADSLSRAIMSGTAKAGKAGLRPLPVLAGGKMGWVAGTIAVDRKTAAAWASTWAKSGRVMTLKAAERQRTR